MSWLGEDSLRRFGKLTPERFLREYWQRKPLFVKNAVPEIASLLAGDDLAGLALEKDVESRLVLRDGKPSLAKSWSLRRGPFRAADFRKLPERDWTLLVQAVDHRLPELADLLDRFSFLPQWRVDDVMVSYAVPGGGVGPHYDSYDVFLIQGFGSRVWKIGPQVDDSQLLPHPDLRILKGMDISDEFLCEPGDLLYLPPGYAHWGIAQEACTTYSVGFRAPSDRELLDGFCNHLIEHTPETERYGDPGLAAPRHPGALDTATLERFRQRIARLVDQPDLLAGFLGSALSDPKYATQPEPPARRYTAAALGKKLARSVALRRHESSRFLLLADFGTLYVDGHPLVLADRHAIELAAVIADHRVLPAGELRSALDHASTQALLLELCNSGHLYFPEAR
ncbi:MAG: JmjC domain-containing protein [Pseudomonadota bacterium]